MSGSRPFFGFIALLLSSATTWAQGTVWFANQSSILSSPPDRFVRFLNVLGVVDGTPVSTNLSGLNFSGLRAQLFYGASSNESSLVAVQYDPASFRSSTSASVGTWFGGTRTLIGFNQTDKVYLQVRAWDISLAPDWNSTQTDAYTGLIGKSTIFTYYVPSYTPSVEAFYMMNFQGFTISPNVPEPTAPALLSLALGCLLFLRRNTTRRRAME